MRKVYAIAFRRYKYAEFPGVDWELTTEETKNVMADNMLTAVDYLRQTERNRIEIQSTHHVCTVDLVWTGEKK